MRYNVEQSIKNQKEYTEKNNVPHFAPLTGKCWNCETNIYLPHVHKRDQTYWITGIDVEKSKKELIAGCPHCNRSYCD